MNPYERVDETISPPEAQSELIGQVKKVTRHGETIIIHCYRVYEDRVFYENVKDKTDFGSMPKSAWESLLLPDFENKYGV